MSRKVPYFLLGITALLSINILLLLQQQPNSDGLPLVQTEFLDSRKLRQYVEPDSEQIYPVKIPHSVPISVGHVGDRKAPTVLQAPQKAAKQPDSHKVVPHAVNTTVKKPTTKTPTTTKKPSTTKKPTTPALTKPVVYGKSPKNTLQPLRTDGYITPNEILQRTAVAIKTFNRAECLMMTVASFKNNYPDIPIFVADDSFEDTVRENLTSKFDVTYIRLPIDSGVGYGRNRLVEHISNLGKAPFFLNLIIDYESHATLYWLLRDGHLSPFKL